MKLRGCLKNEAITLIMHLCSSFRLEDCRNDEQRNFQTVTDRGLVMSEEDLA